MRGLTLISLSLIFAVTYAETVYKTVGEHGDVIFSDQPSQGAEAIELGELQTIEGYSLTQDILLPKKIEKTDAATEHYQALSVVSPEDDKVYRNNAGDVTIQIFLQPALQKGHSLVIKLDGKVIASGRALSVSLKNVDRGTHSLMAKVIDTMGKTLISTSSSFTLLRVALGPP